MAVVRINVTEDIRKEFRKAFASQKQFESQKDFAAHLTREGLKRLRANGTPPGKAPRDVPTANGGNRGIEFDKTKNKDLAVDLKEFRADHEYLSQPVANRACLYAGLKIPLPWK